MCFKHKLAILLLIGTLLFLTSPLAGTVVATSGDSNTDSNELYDVDALNDRINDTLELPDIHENTIIYNGVIDPDFILRVELPGQEDVEQPYVNDDGQFSMNLASEDLNAGDEITFIFELSGEEPGTKINRDVEVQPSKEGMELVESSADTSAVEEVIKDGTTMNWPRPEGIPLIVLDLETIGDVEEPIYFALEGDNISEDKQVEHFNETYYTAKIAEAENFQEAKESDFPQPGDKLNVYITALGVTAVVESEIPADLDVWGEDQGGAFESGGDSNGTGSEENNQSESSTGGSSDDNGTAENNSNDNGTKEAAEETDNNNSTDETANAEESESAVSDSNTSGGIMSPLGWTIIGILVLALIISGIIWAKKRRNA